jgi:uncharacterized membrane protein
MTDWLKFIHVISAVAWVGGVLLMQLYGARVATADRDRRLYFAENNEAAGRFFTIAGILVLLSGIWVVARVDAWEYSQAWISIGFGGVAVGAVLGMAFYGPRTRQLIAQLKANDPAAEGTGRQIALVSGVETLILLIVVWAMVFKPGV